MLPRKSASRCGPQCIPWNRHPVERMGTTVTRVQVNWCRRNTVCRLVFRVEVEERVPLGILNVCKAITLQ
eukprot:4325862-Pleurochrysis_carterae.AAC.1